MAQEDPYAAIAKPLDPYAAIAKPSESRPAGLPDGVTLGQPTDYTRSAPNVIHPTIGSTVGTNLLKTGEGYKGALKSIPSSIAGASKAINSIPVAGPVLSGSGADPQGFQKLTGALDKAGQTDGSLEQNYGKGVGNVAQFFIPGAAEEKGAAVLAPTIGKLAARATTGALGTGIVNAAQGGGFIPGAIAGAAGPIIGKALKSIAPMVAETAMGVRATDRVASRTPGQAILDETTGVSPGSIAQQALDRTTGYTDTLNKNALQSNIPMDLQPARDVAESFGRTAAKQNNATNVREIGQLGSQLDTRGTIAIPQLVSADEGLGLRRGVDALMDSWNPNNKRALSDAAIGAVRKAMNEELSKSIPNFDALNARISSLIPASQRAGAADLNAGVLQRVIGKAARPTGALVGSIAGGTAGYKQDGVRGALIGGGLGLIAPEVATSPTTLMIGARALNSNIIPPYAIPAATGLGLQLGKKN